MAFVTFEGIDGAGKSTAIQAVASALVGDGVPAWTTREETERYGAAIRRSIQDRADPLVTSFLFLADRGVHVKEIQQHLDAGEAVLCDRYMHSTLAYQGVTLAGRLEDAIGWLSALHHPMPKPDLVLLLDLPADVAIARAQARGETAPYEKQQFLEQVRQGYLALAKAEPERFVVLDAAQDAASVATAAVDAVRARFA